MCAVYIACSLFGATHLLMQVVSVHSDVPSGGQIFGCFISGVPEIIFEWVFDDPGTRKLVMFEKRTLDLPKKCC